MEGEKMKEIKKEENPKIKILVGYHKPAVLIKDDILTPIHLGRALATEDSKDGEMPKEDFEWMCENMIGDDTGDNISHLNRYFCGLTGIYWAWKNYDKLGNPDYLGFMHYRRIFDFNEGSNLAPLQEYDTLASVYLGNFDINYKAKLYSLIECSDIIAPSPYIIANNNIESNYKSNAAVKFWETDGLFFDILKEIIKNDFPEYMKLADNYFLQNRLYCFNMFIMPRNIFIRYCEFVFYIIFKLFEQTKNINFNSLMHMRNCAYIGEIVTGLFFEILGSGHKNIKRLNVALFRNTEIKTLEYCSKNFEILNENKPPLKSSPKISVIMPCYNRESYISQAIESILYQTYTDFELIIIDDCSTDNTLKIAASYAKQDNRIILVKKFKNSGIVEGLNIGLYLARGKYIARMDDDISLPQRFEKQVKFMEEHKDVIVLGSLIETFPHRDWSWIHNGSSGLINLLLCFFNPLAHPSLMIRTDFLKEHNIRYREEYKYAEEYKLYHDILELGGKIINFDEVLLYVRRTGKKNICVDFANIQQQIVLKIRIEALSKILKKQKDIDYIIKNVKSWPFERNKAKLLYEVFNLMQNNDENNFIGKDTYQKALERYVGNKTKMHIFFAINNAYTQHLCVTIASMLKNSTSLDDFCFYVLNNGDITKESKNKILELCNLKQFELEFITVDDTLFNKCKMSEACPHITRETYYRYIIPQLKPNLEKSLYLDCDLIVEDSLNLLWNTDLKDNYVGAVEEFWPGAKNYYKENFDIDRSFNAGVLLINHKKWIEDNIVGKLFFNTEIINLQGKNKWVDQDVLNYTFKDRWLMLNPIYNLQSSCFMHKNATSYSDKKINIAIQYPSIIHYTGGGKPWLVSGCNHRLWQRYWEYIKFTPYKEKYNTEYQELLRKSSLGLYGAKERIQSHLSYKLGIKILEARTLKKILFLPFILMQTIKTHRSEIAIKAQSHSALPPIEDYIDYEQALQIKNYLSYRLGNALVKHPFTFVFRVNKIYKEWKRGKGG